MLRVLDNIPSGLTELGAERLAEALGGPSLIHVPGERAPPVFVAVLLHGNEPTGWQAVRQMLRASNGAGLPRALDLFIGNVHAARQHRRRLDGQPDFNRIWKGWDGPESALVERVIGIVASRAPIAVLDIHNTSGRNPLYACYHRRRPDHLSLARAFSETVVCVEHPDTMLASVLAQYAPAVTIECGPPGNSAVEDEVAMFLEAMLSGDALCAPPMLFEPPPVLRTVATVRVPDGVSFAVGDAGAELCLLPDLDEHNFQLVPPGTPIARVREDSAARLEVVDERGRDVSDRYFRRSNGHLVTVDAIMPSLLTLNERIIRQDCLCYVMEPLDESSATRGD